MDLVGYDTLIDFIAERRLLDLPGDLVEVGVLCGGGTYVLAGYLKRCKSLKKVHAIDVFDPELDETVNTAGNSMASLYREILAGRDQYEVFCEVIKGLDNVVVYRQDSKKVSLACDKVCFGFVDGNHDPSYVASDYDLIWSKLAFGGAIAFHDYGYDLPCVTKTIDKLRLEHADDIAEFEVDSRTHVAYMIKKQL